MSKKKKRIFIGAGAAVILAVLIAVWFFFLRKPGDASEAGAAYTTSVAQLTGNLSGAVNRFAASSNLSKRLKSRKPPTVKSKKSL